MITKLHSNPFERLAERQISAPVKAKHRASEKRAATMLIKKSQQEKDQDDKNAQLKIWRAFHRAEIKFVTNGRYHAHWLELVSVIKQMTVSNPIGILEYVAKAQWLLDADMATRRVVLARISQAIIKLREEDGRAPFDDSLPGEDPTVFEIIRERLKVMTA